MTAVDVALPHGYTLRQLQQLVLTAANTVQTTNCFDRPTDRYDLAWSAMIERLYHDDEPIETGHLVMEGRKALYRNDRKWLSEHGVADRVLDSGWGTGRRFAAFWWQHPSTTEFEADVVDRLALTQIFGLLNDRDIEVLTALAVHRDYAAAAAATGHKYTSFTQYVSQARRAFFQLWHEGETPSRMHGSNRLARTNTRDRRSQLTDEQVRELRRRHDAGESSASLAAVFGVSKDTAWMAATGRTYKRVDAAS